MKKTHNLSEYKSSPKLLVCLVLWRRQPLVVCLYKDSTVCKKNCISRSELCKCFIQVMLPTTGQTSVSWTKCLKDKKFSCSLKSLIGLWVIFHQTERKLSWLILGSYLNHVLGSLWGSLWVSAVANQPCEAHWASLSGPSCNIPHNEDILVSFLCERGSQRDDFDLCWRWGWKNWDWGAINELRGVKGASLFCLSRLVTSCLLFFPHGAASAWLFFSAEVIQVH